MRKIFPVLAACAAVVVACASDAPETMAEMLRDAAAALDDAGTGDASAQPSGSVGHETMELACDQEWTAEQVVDNVKSTTRYSYRLISDVDYRRVRSALTCEPRKSASYCTAPQVCTGDVTADIVCAQAHVAVTKSGDLYIGCGYQSSFAVNGGSHTTTSDSRFSKVRLVLDPT